MSLAELLIGMQSHYDDGSAEQFVLEQAARVVEAAERLLWHYDNRWAEAGPVIADLRAALAGEDQDGRA